MESEGNGALHRNSGLSDLTLQLKRRLLAGPVVTSVSAESRVPTGYDPGRPPALGPGEVDYGGRLAVGGATARFYVTGEVGFTVRGGPRSDEVPYALELGVPVHRDATVRAELRGAQTVRPPDSRPGTFDPALADSRYSSAGFALVLRGKPLDLVFAAQRQLSGRNTLAGTRFWFSIWGSR
ncbi:MAG TPA: hypothetical protein VEY91_11785 [Candidatus Limnocylindria bacterium]|nr:hypothetical protein [Candidatus Limnocylindria bacterium]